MQTASRTLRKQRRMPNRISLETEHTPYAACSPYPFLTGDTVIPVRDVAWVLNAHRSRLEPGTCSISLNREKIDVLNLRIDFLDSTNAHRNELFKISENQLVANY
jgi:hypothetical protein